MASLGKLDEAYYKEIMFTTQAVHHCRTLKASPYKTQDRMLSHNERFHMSIIIMSDLFDPQMALLLSMMWGNSSNLAVAVS